MRSYSTSPSGYLIASLGKREDKILSRAATVFVRTSRDEHPPQVAINLGISSPRAEPEQRQTSLRAPRKTRDQSRLRRYSTATGAHLYESIDICRDETIRPLWLRQRRGRFRVAVGAKASPASPNQLLGRSTAWWTSRALQHQHPSAEPLFPYTLPDLERAILLGPKRLSLD